MGHPTQPFLVPTIAVLCGLFIASHVSADETLAVQPDVTAGAKIFAAKCAACHGDDGQGGDEYEKPLFGDESVHELGVLIARTMPEGEPEECVGEEAQQVAAFLHHDFYSRAAREAKGLATAPRIERMRLTVPQYRNAVADLLRHFTPVPESKSDEAGIQGLYYESEKMTKTKDRKLKRVDSKIVFDFGEDAPEESIDKKQFAVIWDGSVDVRDTGYYEFRIHTPNGVRLYLNLDHQPRRKGLRDDSGSLGQSASIDGWVSSSEMRDHTARVFLLGGRRYPFRLEFFKYLEKNASIEVSWKTPLGVWAPLDADNLTTAISTRTFVVDTPFPADDRSLGYERGTSVSHAWHVATNEAAIAVANEVVDRLPILANVDEDTSEPEKKLEAFVQEFAAVAWRRPLSELEEKLFGKVFFVDGADPEVATKRSILFILKSPHFLYTDLTEQDAKPDQYAIAARLASALWDSLPDEALSEAASKGELNEANVVEHAKRMLKDPRAHDKLHGFFHHWLELDERSREKDQQRYPEFEPVVVADLRRSLELFVDEVAWSDASDYRQLLLADHLLLNERLKNIYVSDDEESAESGDENEGENPKDSPFQSVSLSKQERAGVLTHPYLLSALAYADKTSPIHRGVFLTRNIVGRGLKAPPEAVAFKDEEFADDLTMREKITQLTNSTTCMSCHSIINPLGFALESYDSIGRWRTSEDEKPIDTLSKYAGRDGKTIEVRSARDVADFAINDSSAQRAFVTQLFHHTVKQDPLAYGNDTLDELREEFVANEFNIQRLWITIAARTSMR